MKYLEFESKYGGRVMVAPQLVLALYPNHSKSGGEGAGTYLEMGPAGYDGGDGPGPIVVGTLDEVRAKLEAFQP